MPEFVMLHLRRVLFFPVVFFFSARRNLRFSLLSSVGIYIGIIFFLTFSAISDELDRTIRTRLIGDLPINTVHVYTKQAKQGLGILVGNQKFSGISSGQLAAIRKLDGVKWAAPVQYLHRRASMGYRLPDLSGPSLLGGLESLFGSEKKPKKKGKRLYFDAVIAGMPRGLAWEGLRSLKHFKVKDGIVPVLVPQAYLDLMSTYLTVNKLPNSILPDLSSKNWPEIKLKLKVGYSIGMKAASDEVTDYTAVVAGIIPDNKVLAFAAPLDWVKEQNAGVADEAARFYREAFIRTEGSQDVDSVSDSIRKMGLQVSSAGPVARKAGRTMQLIKQFLQGISWVILFVAVIAVANAFLLIVTRRRQEIALLRFMGASRLYVLSLLAINAVMLCVFFAWLAWHSTGYVLDRINEALPALLPAEFAGLVNPVLLSDDLFWPTLLYASLCALAAIAVPAAWAISNRILHNIRT